MATNATTCAECSGTIPANWQYCPTCQQRRVAAQQAAYQSPLFGQPYQYTPADVASIARQHSTTCDWHQAPADMPLAVRGSTCTCGASWLRHSSVCLQIVAGDSVGAAACSDDKCCSGCSGQVLSSRAHWGDATDPCPGYLWLAKAAGLVPFADSDTLDTTERSVLAFVADAL